MTFFRSREQRMADRGWCERYKDYDEAEDFGHGLVIAVTVGAGVYLIFAAFVGWL